MKKLAFLLILILFTSCDVKYWGLVPDTVSVDGYIDLNTGFARIYLRKKYQDAPVTSATVLINGVMLNSDNPGVYTKNLSVDIDTFHLRVELMDELLNFTEVAPSPRNLNYQYIISGDSLKISWERPEHASYFEFIATENMDTVLDTVLVDTEIVMEQVRDSLQAEIISVSGPEWSDTAFIPNINTGVWEGNFKILSRTHLDFNH